MVEKVPSCSDLKKSVAVLEERIVGMERARDLQASEYARRLEELNHAHHKATERNATFVSNERFEAFSDALAIWRQEVDKERLILRGSRAGVYSAISVALAVGAFAVSVINWWVDRLFPG